MRFIFWAYLIPCLYSAWACFYDWDELFYKAMTIIWLITSVIVFSIPFWIDRI
jgi:hypothetical protein